MIEQKKALYEAAVKKMSATDVVIYSDKTPKSLYEYYYYSYKESDIENLINNLRMSFDSWDKSYNLYKTSPAIEEISSGDVSVLYEDHVGNLFIYSFATKKIYYYDKDNPPYVEIKYPMSVKEFLGVAKRDFEALGRTPYGKKFVTESAVLMEGIREVFGFGTALRLFIDGRKNNKANAYDKHSYAFLDAFLQFTPKKLTKDEFDRACGRDKTILEIYTNRKLGNRDENRAMPVKVDALEETKVGSIITFAKEYGVDREKLYWQYCEFGDTNDKLILSHCGDLEGHFYSKEYRGIGILSRNQYSIVFPLYSLNTRSQLEVHHKHYRKKDGIYKKPWEYSNDELMVLCHECHQEVHKKPIPIIYE